MCLYVSYPLELSFVTHTVAKASAGHGTAQGAAHMEHAHTGGADYNLVANWVPNGVYAVNGPHPSNLVVGSLGKEDGTQAEVGGQRSRLLSSAPLLCPSPPSLSAAPSHPN